MSIVRVLPIGCTCCVHQNSEVISSYRKVEQPLARESVAQCCTTGGVECKQEPAAKKALAAVC